MRLHKGCSDIQSVEDWFRFAPPKKGALQWKDGRSAKELARAWCGGKDRPSPTDEFLQLLAPLVNENQLACADGWPEHQVPIDKLRGEPPNIDLAIVSDGNQGHTVICIEAKADESFGRYVSEMHDAATKRIGQGKKTGVLERIVHLENQLFQEGNANLPGRAEIRYQLLTGTAATLAFAKSHQVPIAVFVIHEFSYVGHVDEKKLRQNENDLDHFVMRLTLGSSTSLQEGVLLGPLSPPLPQNDWGGVALYIGKVRTGGGIING